MDLGNWLGALIGGGALALIGTMLTLRDGRQRRYDERTDAELVRVRGDNKALSEENRALDLAHDVMREENARLRLKLIQAGIDPDSTEVRS